MISVNMHVLIGKVPDEPEIRANTSGTPVCNFNIETEKFWTDGEGNRKKRTEKHRCVAWGKLAEICEQCMQAGSRVFLRGESQTRGWTDSYGVKRFSTETVAEELTIFSGRKGRNRNVADTQRGDLFGLDLPA